MIQPIFPGRLSGQFWSAHFRSQIYCLVSKPERLKALESKSRPHFALFAPPPVRIRGRFGEMFETLFHVYIGYFRRGTSTFPDAFFRRGNFVQPSSESWSSLLDQIWVGHRPTIGAPKAYFRFYIRLYSPFLIDKKHTEMNRQTESIQTKYKKLLKTEFNPCL